MSETKMTNESACEELISHDTKRLRVFLHDPMVDETTASFLKTVERSDDVESLLSFIRTSLEHTVNCCINQLKAQGGQELRHELELRFVMMTDAEIAALPSM